MSEYKKNFQGSLQFRLITNMIIISDQMLMEVGGKKLKRRHKLVEGGGNY